MNNYFDVVQRLDIIKQLCANKRVLHLGCTNYPYTHEAIDSKMLLHFELEKICSDLWGLDADLPGIDILESHGSKQILHGDLERLGNVHLDKKFDVIVAGEIIEHLSNAGTFLNGIKRFMTADTLLILTTVNAYCAMRFFYYGARGRRGRAEPVHPDHVAYYSYSTLRLLLERSDLRMERFLFYDLGNEHRQHVRWFIKIVNDICVRFVPQWSDGVIAICRLPG